MSSYPSADDYAFALEPARLAKYLEGDTPLLRTVRAGTLAVPKGSRYAHVANGFFAYIFRVTTAQGDYALRCPRLRFPGNSAARYQSLAQFLRTKPGAAYLVEADHFDKALFVSVGSQGSRFPVQIMAWVTGKTLLEAVAEKSKANDVTGLTALAEAWANLLIEMKTDGVVHGDLHPDNVIVAPDNTLRLVDYDTLIVPGFTPEPTAAGGMATYFHPGYTRHPVPRPTVSFLDDFGALNILLSLRALAENPRLRETCEYLLFTVDDIESPRTSRRFLDLLHHREPGISYLANAFFDECCEPMETGNFRVERFISVTPAVLPWHRDPPKITLPPRPPVPVVSVLPVPVSAPVTKAVVRAWEPTEDTLPSSVTGTGPQTRRVHDPAGATNTDTALPSSLGQTGRRTHPYKPE